MGIDVYLRWAGMTKKEERGQITGFDATKGDVGYLREAYHGEPYATQYLMKECFSRQSKGEAYIKAETLRKRLPKTIKLAIQRQKQIYGVTKANEKTEVVQSFVNFVKLAEMKEKETGLPCTVIASY